MYITIISSTPYKKQFSCGKNKKFGIKFKINEIIEKTKLIDKKRFDAVFIGSCARLPKFVNILGENLNEILSANEFLTRVNFMKGYLDNYEIPIKVGKKLLLSAMEMLQ